MRLIPLNGVFRQTYHYSNFGITEGSLAAVRPLEKQWEDVADELIYRRLGMTRTSSRYSDYQDRADRASLHYLDASGNFRNWFVRNADAESPAGGVNSTARDLSRGCGFNWQAEVTTGSRSSTRLRSKKPIRNRCARRLNSRNQGRPAPRSCGMGWVGTSPCFPAKR